MTTPARLTPIPERPGWHLSSVNRHQDEGRETTFRATVRIDTPQEWLYYRHGGILQYVLRQLLAGRSG